MALGRPRLEVPRKKLTFRLFPNEIEAIDIYASQLGVSRTEFLRLLLKPYLQKPNVKAAPGLS